MTHRWAFALCTGLVLAPSYSNAQVDCDKLDPRASVSTKTEGQVKASVDTLYKIAKASGDVRGRFEQEINNLQKGVPVSEGSQVRIRTLYLFCGMVANAKDISTERKFELYQLMMNLKDTASPPVTKPKQSKQKSKPQQVTKVSSSCTALAGVQKLFIREGSAGDVLRVLRSVESWYRDRKFEELYKGKWTSTSGWQGVLAGLPETMSPNRCRFVMTEDATKARVLVEPCSGACELRDGDRVRVEGRLLKADSEMVTIEALEVKPPNTATSEPKTETKAPRYKMCRHPDFGKIGWQRTETVTQSSGWREGGSNPQNWCNELIASFIRGRSIGSNHAATVNGTDEESRRDVLGHVTYNYHCTITISWEPVYAERTDPRCGVLE